jgi:hypothetical protein
MPTSTSLAADRLALAPMGAGDLLDRTIRLYRRHFLTLIRTAAPPVVIAAVGSVLWVVCFRAIPLTESGVRLALYVMGAGLGLLLWISGPFFLLVVLGGASRNLVAHLLWQEPVSARTVYRNVRARFWGLFGAMMLTALCALMVGSVTFGVLFTVLVLTLGIIGILATGPVSTFISLIVLSIMLLYGLVALLFFF